MKIRLQVLVGEVTLGALALLLAWNGHIEGAVGIAGIIGATLDKLVDKAA